MPKKNDDYEQLTPALTPEACGKRCIALAYNLVEKRLLEGTASSQETTFFLKLGSRDAELETKRLEHENLLLEAKTEALKASKFNDEAIQKVLQAIKEYRGIEDEDV